MPDVMNISAYECVTSDFITCPDADACNRYECAPDPTNPAAPICATIPETMCPDDGNACTNNFCDSQVGCTFTTTVCQQYSLCINRICNVSSGECIDGDLLDCDDGLYCTDDLCDAKKGCIHVPIICPDYPEDDCHVIAGCNETQGQATGLPCTYTAIESLYDFCGTCRGDNIACFFAQVDDFSTAAGIAGGVAAAIVISTIIGLVLAAYASKKGYDFYTSFSANRAAGLHDNPMFADNTNVGEVPDGMFD